MKKKLKPVEGSADEDIWEKKRPTRSVYAPYRLFKLCSICELFIGNSFHSALRNF